MPDDPKPQVAGLPASKSADRGPSRVATGVTTSRFDTGYGFNNYEDTQVVFGPTSVYALHEPFDGQTPVTFTEFDRDTGEVLTTLTLAGITEQLVLNRSRLLTDAC